MSPSTEHEIRITPDLAAISRAARIIATHLTALADDLETPDTIVHFHDELTEEQAAEFRERFKSAYATGYAQGRDDEAAGVATEGGQR